MVQLLWYRRLPAVGEKAALKAVVEAALLAVVAVQLESLTW